MVIVRRLVVTACACACVVVAAVQPAGALPRAGGGAHLTVTPSTGMTDGEKVSISGSGFPPNATQIAIGECLPHPTGPTMCNLAGGSEFVNISASGTFGPIMLPMKKSFNGAGKVYDCTNIACVVASSPIGGSAAQIAASTTQTPISFASAVAPKTTKSTAPAASGGGSSSTSTGSQTAVSSSTTGKLPFTGPVPGLSTLVLLASALVLLGGGAVLMHGRRAMGTR